MGFCVGLSDGSWEFVPVRGTGAKVTWPQERLIEHFNNYPPIRKWRGWRPVVWVEIVNEAED